ncbi:tetratricopeptide repeat protein [Nodosilinea sp. PGN35]|uniref:CHAT domain-containing tetratricopeptide repeat protein n=1 Tax=Nodosilinea sp. PGN35 TaxID=3020489 RepID=UPI0023B2EE79|nr:tetratricopeptide repeat protein [Nodosilinea sp. TSF1-S3]MDF0367921.1 tetratricopeptide repeat protein [Nodosilinea sp. TSF1-S3]
MRRTYLFGLLASSWLLATIAPTLPTAAQPPISLAEQPASAGSIAGVNQLMAEGYQQLYTSQLQGAIASFQLTLVQCQQSQNRSGAAAALLGLSESYLWSWQFEDQLETAQQALEIYQTLADRAGEAAALHAVGDAQLNLGQYDEGIASLQRALTLRQAVQDQSGEGWTLGLIGIGQTKQGDAAQGLATMQQAIAILNAPVDPALEQRQQYQRSVILAWLGHAQGQEGDYETAVATLQQALELARTLGNRSLESLALKFLGDLQKERGEFTEAIASYEAALVAVQALNNSAAVADGYTRIGNLYYAQENYDEARTAYQHALDLYDSLGDRSAQAWRLFDIGHTYKQQKQYQPALEVHRQALALFQAEENAVGELRLLNTLGYTYEALGDYDQARSYFQRQIDRAQQVSNVSQEAFGFWGVGSTYLGQAQRLYADEAYAESVAAAQQAIAPYQQAIDLAQVAEFNPALTGSLVTSAQVVYSTQGLAFDQLRQFPEAIAAHRQSLEILEAYRDRMPEAKYLAQRQGALMQLGLAHYNSGQYAEAITAFQGAAQLAEQLNDPARQMSALSLESSNHAYLGDYAQALAVAQHIMAIATEKLPDDAAARLKALTKLGQAYHNLSQYPAVLEHYQQALSIAQSLGDIDTEISLLNNMATVYSAQGNYRQALETQQQAIDRQQEAIDALQTNSAESFKQFCSKYPATAGSVIRQQCLEVYRYGLAVGLNNQVSYYQTLGRYREAIAAYDQALAIAHEYKNLELETSLLLNIGGVHDEMGNYAEAIAAYEGALAIALTTGSRPNQGIALNNLGRTHSEKGDYPQALESYQRSLQLAQAIDSPSSVSTVLGNLGAVYSAQGRVDEARDVYEQALAINQELGLDLTTSLNNLAVLDSDQGRSGEGLEKLQQALAIAQAAGNRLSEATVLGNMADIYSGQGNYSRSLELRQQSIAIYREIGARSSEISGLIGLGRVYHSLGQYDQAREFHQQALELSRTVGQRSNEALALGNLARTDLHQGQLSQAQALYEQGLALARDIGEVNTEAALLDALGRTYDRQGQSDRAIATYQQALVLARQTGFRLAESSILRGLGVVYGRQGRQNEALAAFQQALTIQRQIDEPAIEAQTLASLGELLAAQNQPEMAIAFYKQSVNLTEGIRASLGTLPADLQQSYTDSVADTYRTLADLLLQQNRVLEAQRVLDLLRVQELDDYLHNVRSTEQTATGVDLWEPEQRILDLYEQTIAEGAELAQLQAKASLTEAETQRRDELLTRQDELRSVFQDFRDRDDVRAAIAQLRTSTDGQNIELSHFNQLQNSLASLDTNAVLLYPLILPDRLELVLITPYSAPIRRPVPVESAELNRAIVELGQALKDPRLNAQAPAQRLYQWVVAPIADDLAAVNAETIIYAPDGPLRYIPLAALHDGEGWLAERFAVSHITAASLVDFTARPTYQPDNLELLAAACVQCSFENINGYRFGDLPNAGVEVETLAAQIPNTELRLNEAFSARDLRALMGRFPIVHLATHAKFVQGQGSESFIVTGDGGSVSLREMQAWNLDADLVVLSACETALGEAQLGSGVEILGFGYQMQTAGAKAAIASLWQVSDGGTQVLMNAFYAALQAGYPKAEALQLAQQALIDGDFTIEGAGDRADITLVTAQDGLSRAVGDNLSHPYYWAPFILIGNGL